jgi:ubiquinone/menaquinone biosynthesis C-methylase UbiE
MGDLFERYYVAAREKEKRLYTDDQLRQLPEVAAAHPYYGEWQVRKRSARMLVKALEAPRTPLSVLEVGCGNGWLARQVAQVPGMRVTGLDINMVELQQARRVFRQQENLQFVAGDLRTGLLLGQQFDRIIFAAAIQYFPSLGEILAVALDHLQEQGEIHILDSFFYEKRELSGARRRTQEYYRALGVPEMSAYYFHHAREELQPFHHQIINRGWWLERLIPGRRKVFPWVKINKR